MLAILDIDGTLVDTNYQHTLAWFRAFAEHGETVAIYQLHRHIGMGGDQVVTAVCDEATEERIGEAVRESQSRHFFAMIEEVRPMTGARELILALRDRGHRVVFASSARAEEVDHYLDLLDARDLAEDWTTSADVEQTKPAPDLVRAALEKAGSEPGDAILIGDTPWDVRAAEAAGVPTLAVLTGGFSVQELSDAGARSIFESVADLGEHLHQTVLR